MSESDSTPSPAPAAEPKASSTVPAVVAPQLSIADLFLAFAGVSISSFGGVLAWARRMLVEKKTLDDGGRVQ
jgi:hypothetical protein